MAERSKHLYSLLSYPAVYLTVQRLFRSEVVQSRLLELLDLRAAERVLDVGCGPATFLRRLPADVTYIGFEPNPAYIAQAHVEFGTRGEFHVGYFDEAAARTIPAVDAVLVKAVLHHMSDDEANALFLLAAKVLKPGGRVVSVDPAYVENQNPISRFVISRDRGRNVRSPEDYEALARTAFLEVAGSVVSRRFPPYDYCVMVARKPRVPQ
jgi:SAM-dependent methyltransferase